MTLRRWLFMLALAATLPLLAFTGYTILLMTDRQAELSRTELRNLSVHLAHVVEDHVDNVQSILNTLAASESLRAERWTEFSRHGQRMLEANPTLLQLSLINQKRQEFLRAGMAPHERPIPTPDPESVTTAIRTGMLHVSAPQILPDTGQGVVFINLPVQLGPDTPLVIRATMDASSFQETMRQQKLPLGAHATVVDHDGDIIAEHPVSVAAVGTQAPMDLRLAIEAHHGTEAFDVQGSAVGDHVSVAPLINGNWLLAVAMSNEALQEDRNQLLLKTLIFGLIWLGLSLLLTHYLAQRIQSQLNLILQVISREGHPLDGTKRLHILEFRHLLSGLLRANSEASFSKASLIKATAERDEVGDLYEHAPCGYITLDAAGRITRINRTLLRWLAVEEERVIGASFETLLDQTQKERYRAHQTNTARGDAEDELTLDIQCADGTALPVQITMATMRDEVGQLLRTRMTLFDIRERRKVEAELLQQARTDALTGLSNRRDFERQAEKELSRSVRFQSPLCLLMIDVDHFKKINDTHGHEFGDLVLKTLAEVYAKSLRDTDTLARIGGEEFAVLMPMCEPSTALDAAERLRRLVASQNMKDPTGQVFQMTVSIGLAHYQKGDTRIDDLMRRADQALYTAKNTGRNRTVQHKQT